MNREIGSEFWQIDLGNEKKMALNKSHQYRLSGRTALDFIIKDIGAFKKFSSVYIPSYCCHTMIQPFLENGIDIEFYDVTFDGEKYAYKINFDTNCDVILIMQYFGYYNPIVEQAVHRLKSKGKIIIEDATHSWFSDNPYSDSSDYIFASFRKWTGLACGAIIIKQTGDFLIQGDRNYFNLNYIEMRERAYVLKRHYIEKGIGEKNTFLELFNKAENLLERDYKNYEIPQCYIDYIELLDTKKIREKRKENAKILVKELKRIKEIKTLDLCEKDVPLFVPVIISNGMRDKLRQYLVSKRVYCPVHWPLSNAHAIDNKYIYDNCLSLVCDQRYENVDMFHIVDLIKNFYRGVI